MIRLNVLLRFDENTIIPVGQLAEDEHRLYFQYDKDFLTKELWLSPYKLPLEPELLNTQTEISALSSACLTIHCLTGGAFC